MNNKMNLFFDNKKPNIQKLIDEIVLDLLLLKEEDNESTIK